MSSAGASSSPNAEMSTPRAVDTLTKTEKANWVIFYFRGICFERSKQWAKAEADLKKALELLSRPGARP